MRGVIAVLAVAAVLAPRVFSDTAYAQFDAPRRYVVVFSGTAVPGDAADIIRTAGGELVTALPQVGVVIAMSSDPRFQTSLRRHPAVLAVGPERSRGLPELAGFQVEGFEAEGLMPEQPLPPTSDNLFSAQWNITRVHADAAWNAAGVTGSSAIVVAVIDNGVASNHRDLMPNLIYSACFAANTACSPYPQIPFSNNGSHGTMVAGIVAATFGNPTSVRLPNGMVVPLSVVGVGPNLALASYNVYELSSDGGFEALDGSVWAAMLDVAERGFRVINLSLGDYVIFPEKEAATWTAWNRVASEVVRRGVTIVASAGNESIDLNGPVAHIPSDLPLVISVGATGIRPLGAFPPPPPIQAFDILAPYSNFGAAVDLVAPGGDCVPVSPTNPACQAAFGIVSTGANISDACFPTANCPTGFVRGIGTSLAAPHVAGVAGLILSRNPWLQPHQVRAILRRTAGRLGDRQQFGHGMVDALEAVNAP